MLGKSFNQPKKETKHNRLRLTLLNSVPTVHNIRLLLAEAEKNKGLLCELPMTTPRGTFLLSCQSDHLSAEPCWTLYEGEDGKLQVWSYINNNLDMITDIVGMSVTSKDSKTEVKLPPHLQEQPPTPAAAAPSPAPVPSPSAAFETAQQEMVVQFDPCAGWQASGAAAQPAMPMQNQPMPPQVPPYSGMPTSAGAPTPAMPWPTYQPNRTWPTPGGFPPAQPMYEFGANPPGSFDTTSQSQPWGDNPNSLWVEKSPVDSPEQLAKFAQSLEARKSATIAELSMDPSVPPKCVDLVLKLQEMVLKGHFTEAIALEALKLAALNNGLLDDGIVNRAKAKTSDDPESLARYGAKMLLQAGLLTEKDIGDAENAAPKHNNSFAVALLAMRKLDNLVLQAAQDCHVLVSSGRIRNDQAIIALHYCVRSRAKLDDALADLSISLI